MMDENDLPGDFLPMHWTWVYVIGFAALLTEFWLLAIIAVVLLVAAVYEDRYQASSQSNFGFDREEIK